MAAPPQTNATSSIVDDRDPRFTYSEGWILAGSSSELDSTAHGSNITGSTAVLTFNGMISRPIISGVIFMTLLGTSLVLYGTISPTDKNGPPISSYAIDNGTASTYIAPITNATLFQQPFYEAYGLKSGEHTLTVTVKITEPNEYWLDFALVNLKKFPLSPFAYPKRFL
jgi:hypothetical protein